MSLAGGAGQEPAWSKGAKERLLRLLDQATHKQQQGLARGVTQELCVILKGSDALVSVAFEILMVRYVGVGGVAPRCCQAHIYTPTALGWCPLSLPDPL